MTTIIEVPDGVRVVGNAAVPGKGYRLEGGIVYGSPDHPYPAGALVVEPVDGWRFQYDMAMDRLRIVPRSPGFISVEEPVTA